MSWDLRESWNFDVDPLGTTPPIGFAKDRGQDFIIVNDQFVSAPNSAKVVGVGAGEYSIIYGGGLYTDVAVEGAVRFDGLRNYGRIGFVIRRVDANNFYSCVLFYSTDVPEKRVLLNKCVGGAWSPIVWEPYEWLDNYWHTLRAEVVDEGTGTRFRIYVDGTEVINYLEDPRSHASGQMGLLYRKPSLAYDEGWFDDVAVYEFLVIGPTLTVESSPIVGVPVTVDGSPVGNTPVSVIVPDGSTPSVGVPPEVTV